MIWEGSDVAANKTQWQMILALSVPQNVYNGHAHMGLPGKADNFKQECSSLIQVTLVYNKSIAFIGRQHKVVYPI